MRPAVTCALLAGLMVAPSWTFAVDVDRSDTQITLTNSAFTATFDVAKSCGTLISLRPTGNEQSLVESLATTMWFQEQDHWVSEGWLQPTNVSQRDLPDGVTLTFDCANFGGFALRKAVTIRDGSPVLQVSYQLQATKQTVPHLIVPVSMHASEGVNRLVSAGGEVAVSDLAVNSLALELQAEWYGFGSGDGETGVVVLPVTWPEMHRVNYVGRSEADRLSLAMRLHPMREFAPGDEVRFAYNLVLADGDLAAAADQGREAGAGPIEYLPPNAPETGEEAAELSRGLRATICPAVETPPVIDGALTEDAWASGGLMDRFMTIKGDRFAAARTSARLLHDSTALYMGIRCGEPIMEQVQANATPGSGRVWTDDCVELFVDPEGDGTYSHLIVNADGVRQDNLPGERAVEPEWTAAATRGEDFWSVEIRVPYRDLEAVAPEVGEGWRINLCRSRLPVRESTCWSPTFDGFHVPERFGVMAFGRPAAQVRHIQTGFDAPAGERALSLVVENTADTPVSLNGEATITAPAGDAERVPFEAVLAAGASETVRVPYELGGPGRYTLTVAVGSAAGRADVLRAAFTETVRGEGLNSTIYPAEKDNNRLVVAKGTVQHLFFIPGNHSEKKHESVRFVLTVPEGIEVIQATGPVHELYYKPTPVSREQVDRDGRSMVRWVFESDKPLGTRNIADAPFYRGWIAGLIPSEDIEERDYPFFFHIEGGDDVEPEHEGTLTITPVPRGAELEHLTLGMSCWTISPNEEFWSRLLDTYRLVGINMVDAWISSVDRKWADEIDRRGMIPWKMLWWFWWNDDYLEAHPEHAAVGFDGEADERMICPEILISAETDAITGLMDPILADVADGRYVGTWWDLEGPGSFNACFCERCIAGFREFAGVADDVELTPLKLQTAYADQWLDFATLQTARLCERMKSYAADQGVDWELAVYSGIQSEHTRRSYRVDWPTVIPVIDVATPSFYSSGVGDLATTFTAGTRSFVEMVEGIKDIPVWNTLSVGHGRDSHYITDGRITRQQIVKSIAWGADGTAQWWWGPTDGRHYQAYADAGRTLAPIEEFFAAGEYAADAPGGDVTPGTTRVAWRLGDQLLVMLFNDTTGDAITASVSVPDGMNVIRQDHEGGVALRGTTLTADVEPLDCRWVVLGD